MPGCSLTQAFNVYKAEHLLPLAIPWAVSPYCKIYLNRWNLKQPVDNTTGCFLTIYMNQGPVLRKTKCVQLIIEGAEAKITVARAPEDHAI